ncbi:hypothetical protein [Vibrio sp. TBV020]|uniref:hypothetical protein n=1 Tax=Vibrio sp. TBV020 TaxID=3137398 RepID=UPI0038CD6771
MKTLIASFVIVAALSGCADHISEPRGTTIEVVPVTYQFKLNTKQQTQFSERLSTFIQRHPDLVTQADWEISAAESRGGSLYQVAKKKLMDAGVEPSHIRYVKQQADEYFMVEVSATTHQVKLEVCHQDQVGKYGYGSLGCNTDTSRWQSMVNPQNAL